MTKMLDLLFTGRFCIDRPGWRPVEETRDIKV